MAASKSLPHRGFERPENCPVDSLAGNFVAVSARTGRQTPERCLGVTETEGGVSPTNSNLQNVPVNPLYPSPAISRMRLRTRLSMRETCTWVMPISLAIWVWVWDLK